MVQRETENGRPPPLVVTKGEERAAVWYFRCGENFRRVLENAHTDDARDDARRAQSYKRIPRISPSGDTFVTRPWPRFITRFADVVSPTRTTTETNENEERPSLPTTCRDDVACMHEGTVEGFPRGETSELASPALITDQSAVNEAVRYIY